MDTRHVVGWVFSPVCCFLYSYFIFNYFILFKFFLKKIRAINHPIY